MKKESLKILTYGNNVLKQVASPVTEFNEDLHELIKGMSKAMKDAGGVGLAAPQVGVSQRVIIFMIDPEAKKTLALINPEIVAATGEMRGEEGCLSLPGIVGEVKRAAQIRVKGQDKNGQQVEIEGTDFVSRVLQHEIDHLNGILFIDYLSFVRRQLVSNKLKHMKKEATQL